MAMQAIRCSITHLPKQRRKRDVPKQKQGNKNKKKKKKKKKKRLSTMRTGFQPKKPPSEDLFVCTGLAPEEETNQGKRFTDFINDSKLSSGFNEEKDDPEVGLNGDGAYIKDIPNSKAKSSTTNDSKEIREENEGSQCKHCGLKKVGEGDEMRREIINMDKEEILIKEERLDFGYDISDQDNWAS
ncbi:hypothetical protein Avbf_12289 [Armadillidium vulgare]|nr:hypothetical protein Avbf_12289 [Armadillidium vulgare]